MHPLFGVMLMGAVGLDTPRSGVKKRIRPPARTGQEARCTPLCGVLLMRQPRQTGRGLFMEFMVPGDMTLPGGKSWDLSNN